MAPPPNKLRGPRAPWLRNDDGVRERHTLKKIILIFPLWMAWFLVRKLLILSPSRRGLTGVMFWFITDFYSITCCHVVVICDDLSITDGDLFITLSDLLYITNRSWIPNSWLHFHNAFCHLFHNALCFHDTICDVFETHSSCIHNSVCPFSITETACFHDAMWCFQGYSHVFIACMMFSYQPCDPVMESLQRFRNSNNRWFFLNLQAPIMQLSHLKVLRHCSNSLMLNIQCFGWNW